MKEECEASKHHFVQIGTSDAKATPAAFCVHTHRSDRLGTDAALRCEMLVSSLALVEQVLLLSRIYGARHPECDCVCGGRNHGAGLVQAMENVREVFLPLLEAGPQKYTIDDSTLRELKQGRLFT